MAISKACKPDNFESYNSLSLALQIFEAFVWILLIVNLSFNQTPDILALCETNLDDSIHSGNFSMRGYLPLIRKDSGTHMHGYAVYFKEGLPLAWDISLEDSADSYLCFRLASLQCFTSFFSIDHLLHLCAWFLILFHLR